MTEFKRIIGSPAANIGISVFDQTGAIYYLDNVSPIGRWSTETTGLDAKFAGADLICGDNVNGVAVAKASALAYLGTLGNPEANWRTGAKPLAGDTIKAITGDNVNGLTAISAKGDVYQLPINDSKAEWKLLSKPFDAELPGLIAGDKNGLLAVGAVNKDQIVRASADCCSWSPVTPKSPIQVDIITGNATAGFVAYGEGQLYSLDAKGVWAKLLRPNFKISAMSGNAKDGVVALLGTGDVVAYCTDLVKGPWCILKILPAASTPKTSSQPDAEAAAAA